MKNLSRRDFLRLSGAAVFAVGMTGALSGCDSSHVNTVTVQTVELNEEVETAYGKVKFTSYKMQPIMGENKWHITCGIEVMAAEGYTLELDNTNFWMELDGKRPDGVQLNVNRNYINGNKIMVPSKSVPITAITEVTGRAPQQLVGRFEYKGIRIKTKPQELQKG